MIIWIWERIKGVLTRLGARVSSRTIYFLNTVVNYLEVGRWMAEQGFVLPKRARTREQLFDQLSPRLCDSRILYLEFGVYKGDSMRYWSNALKHPETYLHGFDSFEGLPDDWTFEIPSSYFSTGGQTPEIADPRVRFFKGWFEETLPRYTPPSYDQVLVNIDCDLYSSTCTVLSVLYEKQLLKRGTYIYFDEFHDRNHELKAFREFLEKTSVKVHLFGVTSGLTHVIFQFI
jgi:hypothetical protein